MATISLLKSGNYRAQIRVKNIKHISGTFLTKKEAEVYIFRIESEIDSIYEAASGKLPIDMGALFQSLHPDLKHAVRHLPVFMRVLGSVWGNELTLARLIDEFVYQYTKKDNNIYLRLKWWSDLYGDVRIKDVTEDHIRFGLNELLAHGCTGKKGVSPQTTNRYKANISSVFEFGKQKYHLKHNPCRDIKAKPEGKGRKRYLTDEEQRRFLAAARQSRWEKFYLEELAPFFYIPPKLIAEVWGTGDSSLILTKTLFVLPDALAPEQILALPALKNRPALHDEFSKYLAHNPGQQKVLHDRAAAVAATNALATRNYVPSSVTIGCTIIAQTLAALLDGKLEINGELITQDSLLVSILDDVQIRTLVERRYSNGADNFQDVILKQARVYAENISQIRAGKNAEFIGAATESGVLTQIIAMANILDLPVELVEQRVQHFYEPRKTGTISDIHVLPHTSTYKSKTLVSMVAEQNIGLVAPKFKAPAIEAAALQGRAVVADAKEQRVHTENISSKRRGVAGTKRKTTMFQSQSVTSVGANFEVDSSKIQGRDGVVLQNVSSSAKLNVLTSADGEVHLLLGCNMFSSVLQQTSKDLAWQKMKTEITNQKTFSIPSVSGIIEVNAKQLRVEVKDKSSRFLEQINYSGGQIQLQSVSDYYDIQTKKVQGPGPGLATLVAVTAAILTQGAASSAASKLLGGIAEGTSHAMLSAGFSSLFAQASVSIIANEGNPIAALKAMANKDAAKGLAIAMLSAGILNEVSTVLKLPKIQDMKLLEQHLQYNILKASVSASINVSVNGQDMGEAILGAMVDAGINTITSTLVIQNKITSIEHKVLQTAIGALKGSVTSQGVLFGALEGLVSSVLPDMLRGEAKLKAASSDIKTASTEGGETDATKYSDKENMLVQHLREALGDGVDPKEAKRLAGLALTELQAYGKGDVNIGIQAYGNSFVQSIVNHRHEQNLRNNLPSTLEGTRQAVYAELDTVARQSQGDFAKMAHLLKHGPQPELRPAAFVPLASAAVPVVSNLLAIFGSFALVAKVQEEYSKIYPTLGSRSSSTRGEFEGVPPMMQLYGSVLSGFVESYVSKDNPLPANSKDTGVERPKLPIKSEYPIHEDEWLNNLINPAHVGSKHDTSALPGKSLDGARVNVGPLFTPMFDGDSKSDGLLLKSTGQNFGRTFVEGIAGAPMINPPPPDDEDLFDRMIKCNKGDKYSRIKGTNLWASRDRGAISGFSHGNVYWKIYKQIGSELVHQYETNEFFDIIDKHKGPRGIKVDITNQCRGVPGWKGF